MADKMPPELLARFQKKDPKAMTDDEKKSARQAALAKAKKAKKKKTGA
jgi:hypothetical protein